MKPNTGKWLWTFLILLVNVLLWAIPSDVAYLIAQQRDILLGRYTVSRATTLLLLIPVSISALYLTWANQENKRKRQFQVIALSISILVSMFTMDVFLRLIERKNYVGQSDSLHRPPNTIRTGVTKDLPEAVFNYAKTPQGYPDIKFTLTVDKRGFRNKTDLPKYDIAAIGDSFTEGSGVSDDQTWPALLAQKSGSAVYNLGMSGGNPDTYLETLKRFIPELSPKTVICMLYEGNDFREANFEKKAGIIYNLEHYFKASPLRQILKNSLVHCFCSSTPTQPVADTPDNNRTGPEGPPAPLKALSWLPAAIPDGRDPKYYAFKVKALTAHYENKDKTTFINSTGCRKTFEFIGEIKKICDQNKTRFILVYAPDKPHVLLPLLRDRLSAEQLYDFMALKEKNLPPAKELMDIVLSRINIAESVTEEFCQRESIEFISLTEPLLDTIAQGGQAYFTYDQHWTPTGQQATAETICRFIQTSQQKPK